MGLVRNIIVLVVDVDKYVWYGMCFLQHGSWGNVLF